MSFRALRMLVFVVPLLTGCGYNELQLADQNTASCWTELLAQYRQRADLVPALLRTVETYLDEEHAALAEVTAAIGQVRSLPDGSGWPQAAARLAQHHDAQKALGKALSRMMFAIERSPDLMADASFRDLRAQLDGSESRIAAARNCLVQAVEHYNATLGFFPNNLLAMFLDYKPRPTLALDDEDLVGGTPPADFGGSITR